jgi:Ca2+-binding EF-hand superfamily protein
LYLPVYEPSEQEKKDPDLFAHNVRTAMAKALDVPCTRHTYDDVRFAIKAGEDYVVKNIVPKISADEVKKLTELRTAQAVELVEMFRKNDSDGDGKISLEEFKASFSQRLPAGQRVEAWEAHLERIFRLLDSTGDGSVDFREAIIGMSLGGKQAMAEGNKGMLKLAFQVYDIDGDGHVTRAEVERVLAGVKRYRPRVGSDADATGVAAQLDGIFEEAGTEKIDFETFAVLAQKQPLVLESVLAFMKTQFAPKE